MNATNIGEHMEVVGFCGGRLGEVDHVEGTSIQLTGDSAPDGQTHYIPMSWVDHVDEQVHIDRTCRAARREWESATVIVAE